MLRRLEINSWTVDDDDEALLFDDAIFCFWLLACLVQYSDDCPFIVMVLPSQMLCKYYYSTNCSSDGMVLFMRPLLRYSGLV